MLSRLLTLCCVLSTCALLAQTPGCTDPSACNFNGLASVDDGSCCTDNCLVLELVDSFGDGWNGAIYTIVNELTMDTVLSGTLTAGSLQVDSLCLANGCYLFAANGGAFDSEIPWALSGVDGALPLVGGAVAAPGLPLSVGGAGCGGLCNDEAACNYDPSGTTADACIYPGCTDPTACNYDAEAGCADDSCTFPAESYLDCDGNCLNDTNDNGLCDELEIPGCTDASACNYNPEANTEDGSCCADNCFTLTMTDTFGDGCNGAEYFLIALPAQDTVATGTMTTGSLETVFLCGSEGCYRFAVGLGAFASEVGWTLEVDAAVVGTGGAGAQTFFGTAGSACTGCADSSACNYDPLDTGIATCLYPGCDDETACNYDPEANCLDPLLCEYPDSELVDCEGDCINDADGDGICDEVDTDGCTYPQACNYNASATLDDGSCVFPGCIYPSAVNFDPAAACDDGSCLFGGCMYAAATNYDGEADVDDGSCVFNANVWCPADVNNDGTVDAIDILSMLPNYGAVCDQE